MAQKTKVPKRIAGVKLPKQLRRGLRDLARTQNGRTVLTEALVAAAGLLVTHEAQPGSTTRQAVSKNAPRAKAKAAALASEARSWTDSAGAFQDAARAFTDTLQRRATKPASTDREAPPIASLASQVG